MRRLAVLALAATVGWWLAILTGMTFGSIFVFAVSPLAGRIVGALVAGALGAFIESRADVATRGKRLRFVAASALATVLSALALLDVQSVPWLVGALFGGALGAAQALALGLDRRAMAVRSGAHAIAWAFGFLVLHGNGPLSKLGVVGPAVAVVLVAFAASRARAVAPAAAAA